MIQFRQKEFIAPLLLVGIAGTGITAASAIKSHNDAKAQEGELEKQNDLIKSQNKRLEKIKEELPRPPKQKEYGIGAGALLPIDLGIGGIEAIGNKIHEGAMEGKQEEQAELMREQGRLIKKIKERDANVGKAAEGATKTYSFIPSTQTLKGLGRAAKSAFGKSAKSNIIMGTAMAGSVYAANKYIQKDMKKEGMEVGNDGMLQQKSYANPTPALKNLYQGAKKTLGQASKKYHLGTVSMGAAFGGVPLALGYAADKQQAKDMQAMTQQKSYGKVDGMLKTAKAMTTKGWWKSRPLFEHPGRTITGAASNLSSFGMGGTKNIQKFGDKVLDIGKKQGNSQLTSIGRWVKNNPAAANAAAIVPGAVAAKVTWDGSSKLVEKGARAADPNAYKYQDSKNQQIQ